jgi:hypothetical protein
MKKLIAVFIVPAIAIFVGFSLLLAAEPGAVYPGSGEGMNGLKCSYEDRVEYLYLLWRQQRNVMPL